MILINQYAPSALDPYLPELAQNPDEIVKDAVALVIGQQPLSPERTKIAIALLEDRDSRVKIRMIESLSTPVKDQRIELIKKTISGKNASEPVKDACHFALAKIEARPNLRFAHYSYLMRKLKGQLLPSKTAFGYILRIDEFAQETRGYLLEIIKDALTAKPKPGTALLCLEAARHLAVSDPAALKNIYKRLITSKNPSLALFAIKNTHFICADRFWDHLRILLLGRNTSLEIRSAVLNQLLFLGGKESAAIAKEFLGKYPLSNLKEAAGKVASLPVNQNQTGFCKKPTHEK